MTTTKINEFVYINGGPFELHYTIPSLSPTNKWNGPRRIHRLNKPFRIRLTYEGGYWKHDVPEGFETDLASFPLVLQLLLGNRDDYAEESLLHDSLYREGIPVFFANAMMRIIMERLGRPWWKRFLVFYGLMLFGYRSWSTFKKGA